jgi:hypothetical protein
MSKSFIQNLMLFLAIAMLLIVLLSPMHDRSVVHFSDTHIPHQGR